MSDSGIVAGVMLMLMVLREIIPLLVKVIRSRSDRPPPPAPAMRAEMPTPDYSGSGADGSGSYRAVQFATRTELAELGGELRDLHKDIAARLAALARDVGRIEGTLEQLITRRRPS